MTPFAVGSGQKKYSNLCKSVAGPWFRANHAMAGLGIEPDCMAHLQQMKY